MDSVGNLRCNILRIRLWTVRLPGCWGIPKSARSITPLTDGRPAVPGRCEAAANIAGARHDVLVGSLRLGGGTAKPANVLLNLQKMHEAPSRRKKAHMAATSARRTHSFAFAFSDAETST